MRLKVDVNPLQMPQYPQRKGDAIYPWLVNRNKELLRSWDTEKLRDTSFALVMLRSSFTFILKGKLDCGCKNDYCVLEVERVVQMLISILLCYQGNL